MTDGRKGFWLREILRGGISRKPRVSRRFSRRRVARNRAGRLVAAVTNAFGDAVISSFGYGNDAAGRRTSVERGGSAFGDLAGSADSYGYDARSEVVSALREKNGAEVYGFLEDFAYDPIGNRTESAVYDENGTRYASTYLSNERNQYVSRTVPGLASARGDADARATVTVNENPAYRLGGYFYGTASFDNTESDVDARIETYAALPSDEEGGDDLVAAVTNRVHVPQSLELFAYDANGNRTVVETPAGRWTVGWNAENRPVRWTCGNRTLLMAYDHMGRRVRYVEMTGGVTNKVATFLYDGHLCIARTENGVTDRFLWDPTEPVATRPLATVADGTAYLYAHDANKNVSEVVNALTGETAAHYDYSAFGRTLVAAGPLAHRNPFRFSSEYVDDAMGLTYYNWRHYDPVHGSWLSEDPVGEMGGLNLYSCVNNNLIDKSDRLGLCFQWWKSEPFHKVEKDLDNDHVKDLNGLLDGLGMKNSTPYGYTKMVFTGKEVRCTCPSGSSGKWVFDSANIAVRAEVHLRPLYEKGEEPTEQQVLKAEMDHVNDLSQWVDQQRTSDVWSKFAQKQKKKCFSTREDCERTIMKELDELLEQESLKGDAESMRRWDKSGKHTWKKENKKGSRR